LAEYALSLGGHRGKAAHAQVTGTLTAPQPGQVVLDYQPDASAEPFLTPTTGIEGIYVLVDQYEKIAPSTPATRPAENQGNERTRALYGRRREMGSRHTYTLEPIGGENFGPWIKIRNNLRKDRQIVGLYAYVQWDGTLPEGRTFGVRGSITGGTPPCKTDIAEAVQPRAELEKQWIVEGYVANPIRRPEQPGNGFLFPVDVQEGVAGTLKLTGEICVYQQALGTSKFATTEPTARQPLALTFKIPPPIPSARTQFMKVFPRGMITGGVVVADCQPGRRLITVEAGKAKGFGIFDAQGGSGSCSSLHMIGPVSLYEKPPAAIKLKIDNYGKPIEVIAPVEKWSKVDSNKYQADEVNRCRAKIKELTIARKPNPQYLSEAYANLAGCLRDPDEVVQAYGNCLKYERQIANDSKQPTAGGVRNPAESADTRYVKMLLSGVDLALRHGRFDHAQAWCAEARRVAEPLYGHSGVGKTLLHEMAWAEKTYAEATVWFKGDLETARRLWARNHQLAKRSGDQSPYPYPFEVDGK